MKKLALVLFCILFWGMLFPVAAAERCVTIEIMEQSDTAVINSTSNAAGMEPSLPLKLFDEKKYVIGETIWVCLKLTLDALPPEPSALGDFVIRTTFAPTSFREGQERPTAGFLVGADGLVRADSAGKDIYPFFAEKDNELYCLTLSGGLLFGDGAQSLRQAGDCLYLFLSGVMPKNDTRISAAFSGDADGAAARDFIYVTGSLSANPKEERLPFYLGGLGLCVLVMAISVLVHRKRTIPQLAEQVKEDGKSIEMQAARCAADKEKGVVDTKNPFEDIEIPKPRRGAPRQ